MLRTERFYEPGAESGLPGERRIKIRDAGSKRQPGCSFGSDEPTIALRPGLTYRFSGV